MKLSMLEVNLFFKITIKSNTQTKNIIFIF